MEWQLPIQKVEIGNINIGSPWAREHRKEYAQKPMAPLSYFGTQFRLPFVTFLFPPLPILEYNAQTGKLELDMSVGGTHLACIKMNTFQETLINAITYHQHSWFRTDFKKEEVKSGFQHILVDNHLVLHCPLRANSGGESNTREGRAIPLFVDGAWRPLKEEDLTPGKRVRVAMKIHGISFLQNTSWSGRCRLQHRIVGLIQQADV